MTRRLFAVLLVMWTTLAIACAARNAVEPGVTEITAGGVEAGSDANAPETSPATSTTPGVDASGIADAATDVATDADGAPAPAASDARFSAALMDELYKEFSCERPDVQCLTLSGEPLIPKPKDAGTEPPEAVLLKRPIPNATHLIYVVGEPNTGGSLTCTAGSATWTSASTAPDGGGVHDRYLRAVLTVRVPDLPTFDVSCKQSERELFRVPITVATDDKPFHFEAVVLVPFVFGGDRTIYRAPLAGTEESVMQHRDDLKITAAIGLHYFPLGIYGAGPWANDPRGICANAGLLLRWPCRFIFQPIGLEVGATVDIQNWYVGAAFEPIRGGAFSIGVSAVKGDFYQAGYRDGMIAPSDGLPVDRRYMFRPYFGLSISPELLKFVVSAFQSVREIAPPDPPQAKAR